MKGKLEKRDLDSLSPVYERRSPAILAAGLPFDELCRGMHDARALRRGYFEAFVSRRLVGPARKLARSTGDGFTRWSDNLHRSPFTSVI